MYSTTIQEGSLTITTTSHILHGDFVQSGVTITVDVQASITGELCDPLSNSTTIDGGEGRVHAAI